MKNTKLTSVKIIESLYEQFKLNTVNTKMTLQKFTVVVNSIKDDSKSSSSFVWTLP